ncbi:succinate dehydrogenase subunit C [Allonocardiopsis opalescens]|uniref:Succinate dehydrogenase subunit C n=2 Tax=Allonocardiopsis opalescens TaxID=1144618 RepID=A0A2T0QDB7_9ACTN|nr:succinate dehydrogenase subunit C [Allonocardiopsis opalescens]
MIPTRYRSSVFLKAAMAVTGAVMVLFLIMHMVGNLKAFEGQESFDAYSHWLRVVGYPAVPEGGLLWAIRIALTVSVVVHIASATVLALRARRARPQRYQTRKRVRQSYASRTMRWGGVIIAVFVLYHILHLTVNVIAPGGASDSPYERLVNGFQQPLVAVFYIVSLLLVGLHLQHGLWSVFATLGASSGRREPLLRGGATALSVLLIAGFMLVPVSVMIGWVS